MTAASLVQWVGSLRQVDSVTSLFLLQFAKSLLGRWFVLIWSCQN